MNSKKTIGLYSATFIVIANMIGTGVFTSLGFQVLGIKSGFAIILLWLIGGVSSLCGALVYGEIGSVLPRSGGEYNYLSKIYHPVVGFLSGWISATVAFAAPVAAAAMALGGYASSVYPSLSPQAMAIGVVILLTAIHATDLKFGSKFQNVFTVFKIASIIIIILFGLLGSKTGDASFGLSSGAFQDVFSSAFAVSLFWVSYSYSGWNASAYIAGEIENPQKNLPKSLFQGTLIVTILYVLLNFVFLYAAPISELAGQKEVGYIASKHIFGDLGGKAMGIIISLLLVSSVSAMIIAGPRVAATMGEDIKLLSFFAKKNKNGVPSIAIITQSVISLLFIVTSTFEQVIIYIGFTLSIFTFLTVLGVFILRKRNQTTEKTYKTWGYPITPIVFLLINGWIIYYGLTSKPTESLAGLATVLSGLVVYYIASAMQKD